MFLFFEHGTSFIVHFKMVWMFRMAKPHCTFEQKKGHIIVAEMFLHNGAGANLHGQVLS